MRSLNSAWLLAAPRCTVISEPPPIRKCTWESLKPGRRRRPPRSMTRVSGPASFLIAALLPTARILEPSSATAWAVGCAGFSVHSLALTRIRLASVADALQQQAPSTTMSEHSQESFIATPFKLRHHCPRSRENRGKTGNVSGLYNSISERALWSSARVGSSLPRSLPSHGQIGSNPKVRVADQPSRTRVAASVRTRLEAPLARPGWDEGSGSSHVRCDYKILRRF